MKNFLNKLVATINVTTSYIYNAFATSKFSTLIASIIIIQTLINSIDFKYRLLDRLLDIEHKIEILEVRINNK